MSIKLLLAEKSIHFSNASNQEIRLICPHCEKLQSKNWDDPKLYYNIIKRKGHCFRCNLDVHSEKEILTLFNITVLSKLSLDIPQEKPAIQWPSALPESCIPAYKNPAALAYLRSRNLTIHDIKQFGILYCQEGWYIDRIIIPVFDHRKQYKTFVSRNVGPLGLHRKKYEYPKYCGISHLLFNLHFLAGKHTIWLTEGIFDALHTFPYSVATFGKHLSDTQMNLLKMHGCLRIVLMWDNDAHSVTPDLWKKAVARLKKYFFVTEVKLPLANTDPTNYTMEDLHSLVRKEK